MGKLSSDILAALRTTTAALACGLGAALGLWLVLMSAAAALALALTVLLLAIVPVLLIAIGVKLWPGSGLRLMDEQGNTVPLLEAIAHGIRTRRRPGSDPAFLRRKAS